MQTLTALRKCMWMQCPLCSPAYNPTKAIDGNSVSLDYPAWTTSTAVSVQAPALVGVQVQLDRVYSDIVAVQVNTHMPERRWNASMHERR